MDTGGVEDGGIVADIALDGDRDTGTDLEFYHPASIVTFLGESYHNTTKDHP